MLMKFGIIHVMYYCIIVLLPFSIWAIEAIQKEVHAYSFV